MKVKELIEFSQKTKIQAGMANKTGKYVFFTSSEDENKRFDEYSTDGESIIMGTGGNATLHYYSGKCAVSTDCLVLKTKSDVKSKYLYYFFKQNIKILQDGFKGAGLKHTNKEYIGNIELNKLPDINIQNNIINEIDNVTKVINLYQSQLQNLDLLIKSRFVEMFGDINDLNDKNSVKLGSICETVGGGTPSTKIEGYYDGSIPWITTVVLGDVYIDKDKAKDMITEKALKESATHLIPKNSIMVGTRVGVGKCSINKCEMCTNQDINSLININEKEYNKVFLKFVIDEYSDYFNSIKKGATILGITTQDLKGINVPKVSIDKQNQYKSFVEKVDKSKFVVQKALDKTKMLMDSLMQEYFG